MDPNTAGPASTPTAYLVEALCRPKLPRKVKRNVQFKMRTDAPKEALEGIALKRLKLEGFRPLWMTIKPMVKP